MWGQADWTVITKLGGGGKGIIKIWGLLDRIDQIILIIQKKSTCFPSFIFFAYFYYVAVEVCRGCYERLDHAYISIFSTEIYTALLLR